MHRKLLTLAAGLFLAAAPAVMAADTAKYVFLFIGDGMGPVQVQSANLASQAIDGTPLRMETFPVKGQIQTHAANAAVTDSAAAGTALAAGVKTNNGMVGQLPDGTPAPSISAKLIEAGYKVGVLSSVGLNHATPASFFAHSPSRNRYNEIASQLPASGVHLVIGNGLLSESQKQDDTIQAWTEAGVVTIKSLKDTAPTDARLVAILSYPGASTEKKLDGPGELANSVTFAIDRLKNDRGFFITVEGGKIDGEGHNNRAGEAIDETMAMDRAVEVAYAFYQQNPQETLIVVTADHETGGMTFHEDRFNLTRILELTGKGADVTRALKQHEAISEAVAAAAMAEVLGIAELNEEEKAQIAKAVEAQTKDDKGQVSRAAMTIAQARAGITWSTGGHTGVDCPVRAIGVGAEDFAGSYDNTEIPGKILRRMLAPAAVAQ